MGRKRSARSGTRAWLRSGGRQAAGARRAAGAASAACWQLLSSSATPVSLLQGPGGPCSLPRGVDMPSRDPRRALPSTLPRQPGCTLQHSQHPIPRHELLEARPERGPGRPTGRKPAPSRPCPPRRLACSLLLGCSSGRVLGGLEAQGRQGQVRRNRRACARMGGRCAVRPAPSCGMARRLQHLTALISNWIVMRRRSRPGRLLSKRSGSVGRPSEGCCVMPGGARWEGQRACTELHLTAVGAHEGHVAGHGRRCTENQP